MLTLHVSLPYALDDPHEQGGLLFGPPREVRACTGPLPGDDRGTHHLTMLDPGHEAAADAAAAQGWGYLGYWHSHPAGSPPDPSEVDLTDWQLALGATGAAELYFPIITGGVLRVWRARPGEAPEEVAFRVSPASSKAEKSS